MVEEVRHPAGPLPSKRGEIGFQDVEGEGMGEGSGGTDAEILSSLPSLPARHPADRDHPSTSPQIPNGTQSPSPPHTENTPDSSSTHSSGKHSVIAFFKHKKIPTYFGIRLTTLILLLVQMLLLGGTTALWILAIKRMYLGQSVDNQDNQLPKMQSIIVIHVIFAVVTLGQLIFFERRLFRARAERYMYLHPGDVLPAHRRGSVSSIHMGYAPWNRPPLPTYAAALAQSGFGTGDVEDNIIAAPPPPAYGNTRGSMLLLSGFLRESLRAQRPVSAHNQESTRQAPKLCES